MVENPNTWGPVEKVIAQAIEDQVDYTASVVDPKQGPIKGASLPSRIAQMLRDKGYLREGL